MESSLLNPSVFDCLARLTPGPTIHPVLRILSDPQIPTSLQTDLMAAHLAGNQAFVHYLQNLDLLQRMNSEWSGLGGENNSESNDEIAQRICRILGHTGARNSLLCLKMQIMLGQGLPKKAGESLRLDVAARLKFATEIEDLWLEKRWSHRYQAFIGGLHYDWLLSCLDKDKKIGRPIKGYLGEVWTQSLKIALVAQALGSLPQPFTLQEYVVPAALLMGIGRVLMAFNFPGGNGSPKWLDFQKEISKSKQGSPLRNLTLQSVVERKRFPLTHNQFSALVASSFGYFNSVIPAIQHSRECYLLKQSHPDLYVLAVVLSTAEELVLTNEVGTPQLSAERLQRITELGPKMTAKEITKHVAKFLKKG